MEDLILVQSAAGTTEGEEVEAFPVEQDCRKRNKEKKVIKRGAFVMAIVCHGFSRAGSL